MQINNFKKIFNRIMKFLFVLVGMAVVVNTISQMHINFTNIPQGDEWTILSNYILSINQHSSFIKYLWMQHNEHRVLVSKIIMILDLNYFYGKGILSRVITLAAIFLNLTIFLIFLKKYVKEPSLVIYFIGCCITVILFSDLQEENFIRGFNNQVVLVCTFFILSLWFMQKYFAYTNNFSGRLNKNFVFFVSILFACLSTYTMAGGILVWPILILYCWSKQTAGSNKKAVIYIITISFFVVASYLWNTVDPFVKTEICLV